MAIINDGTGTGKQAKVDGTNKVLVRSTSRTEQQDLSIKGRAFNLSSGIINLTSDGSSALMYFKNEELQPITINAINVLIQGSTGGSDGYVTFGLTKNPTGLSSGGGSDVIPINLNFGSALSLNNVSEVGKEGATVIGGSFIAGGVPFPVERYSTIDVAFTLPKGGAIAVSCTPMSGNTSLNVAVLLEANLIEES